MIFSLSPVVVKTIVEVDAGVDADADVMGGEVKDLEAEERIDPNAVSESLSMSFCSSTS